MNALIIVGFLLYACTRLLDRFVHKVPSRLAVTVYAAALCCILAGMIVTRTGAV